MALDYLTIPGKSLFTSNACLTYFEATSVEVEWLFSKGCLILTHTHSRLSSQSTRALLCIGSWSLAGHIKDEDILKVAREPELDLDEEVVYEDGWDAI